jgi:hypothetical protein
MGPPRFKSLLSPVGRQAAEGMSTSRLVVLANVLRQPAGRKNPLSLLRPQALLPAHSLRSASRLVPGRKPARHEIELEVFDDGMISFRLLEEP